MRYGIAWVVLVAACSSAPGGEAGADSGAGASGVGGDADASGQAGTGGTGTGGTFNCTPGFFIYCDCPNGELGTQTCSSDGWGWGPCMCLDGGGNQDAEAGAAGAGGMGATDGGAGSGGAGGSGGSIPGDSCSNMPPVGPSGWQKDCATVYPPCATCTYIQIGATNYLQSDYAEWICGPGTQLSYSTGPDVVVPITIPFTANWSFHVRVTSANKPKALAAQIGPTCPPGIGSGSCAVDSDWLAFGAGFYASGQQLYLAADTVLSGPINDGAFRFYACHE